ncbi:Protein of unknown function [Jatrophihabitans endophyticus]|uniref:DUF2470 domain-containing protein n=1 Tax=Jatrophihabitans endophyticus TaxID=1206085 RepID=A0A1M5CAT8_9ACTN|nr:DUF2470 domain-containing protein [Jatrophihabitans endophyticus]SHF51855.1 Protein of unknown function [Jatrophihabitans endophyticus]
MTAVEADLAVVAREVLALAPGGTLHVRGLSADAAAGLGCDAAFYDDDGRPSFVVPPDSPLAEAATSRPGAVLAVPAGAAAGVTQLVLGGHLAVVEQSEIQGSAVVVVGLLVHSVVLENDAPDSPTVAYRSITLDAWTAARPDPLHRAAQRLVSHTNHAHGAQLREYVAALRMIPAEDVIAAELAELDATGVQLQWLDERGAHRVRVRFPEPAHCPASLASSLRETLTG